MNVYLLLFLIFLPVGGFASPQEGEVRERKPVLVRDEVNKPDEEKVPVHDPEQARKHVEVGDFYMKRDNYAAAEERYRLAVEYNKSWPNSYRRLIEVLEKLEQYGKAIEVCDLFLKDNPASEKRSDFEKLRRELERKAQSH